MIKLNEHPLYEQTEEDLEAFQVLFEGDQGKLKKEKYLWAHELELKAKGGRIRALRETRSSYTNWAEVLVSIWTSVAFRRDPTIPPEVADLLGEAIENIDGKGSSLISFIREQVVQSLFVSGRPIIRVSSLGNKPATKAEENAGKFWQPYFELISPLAFKDWGFLSNTGVTHDKFAFCRLEYQELEDRASSKDAPVINTYSKEYSLNEGYLTVTKYKKTKSDKGEADYWEEVSVDELRDWDEIPIVAKFGESWLKDVSPHLLKYYNTESVIDNIVLHQAHQRIIFIGDIQGEDAMNLSETSINVLPSGSSVTVISPTDTSAIDNRLNKILSNIFRIGLNMLKMQLDSAQVESSDTLKQVKDGAIALIQAEIESVETIVNEAIRLFAKYKGQQDFTAGIKFNVDDLENSIDEAIKLISVFRDDVRDLPKLKKSLLNWFIDRFDLGDKEELKAEVEQMIDSQSRANQEDIRQQLYQGLLDGSKNGQ